MSVQNGYGLGETFLIGRKCQESMWKTELVASSPRNISPLNVDHIVATQKRQKENIDLGKRGKEKWNPTHSTCQQWNNQFREVGSDS
jgi:hypothetical protein